MPLQWTYLKGLLRVDQLSVMARTNAVGKSISASTEVPPRHLSLSERIARSDSSTHHMHASASEVALVTSGE